MLTGFYKLTTYIALLLALSLAVSSCGRRGNLEAPPSSSVISVDEEGNEVPPPEKPDEPFVLDPLL